MDPELHNFILTDYGVVAIDFDFAQRLPCKEDNTYGMQSLEMLIREKINGDGEEEDTDDESMSAYSNRPIMPMSEWAVISQE